jgi:hypothetical protein
MRPINEDHGKIPALQLPRQKRFGLFGRPSRELSAHARPARPSARQLLGERFKTCLVAGAHAAEDLLYDSILKGILRGHPAQGRQLDLFAGDAANARFLDSDLSAAEHETSFIVAVPVRPPIGAGLMARATQGRPVLLELLSEHPHAADQDELAKSLTGVQDHSGTARLGRGHAVGAAALIAK